MPMLAWKIREPSREKLFSCGESPEGIRPTILPVRVSITATTFAVDAETSSRRPFLEMAIWSARLPPTLVRQRILPVLRSMATTSAKLGREKKTTRPSGEVKPSSTYWLWPSPTSVRMLSKKNFAVGSALISAIRARLSGMTLMRLSRLNVCGSTRSAVPAQLLLTTSTSRVPLPGAADVVAGARAAVAMIAESSIRGRGIRITPRIMSPYPPRRPSEQQISGGGGIRTLGGRCRPQRFSRPPRHRTVKRNSA